MSDARLTGPRMSRTRSVGIALAAVTAVISGVAVFVNDYGVRRWPDATAYTTAKNLVAAIALAGIGALATSRRPSEGLTLPPDRRHALGLLAIGVIGGSVPFVLFFEGLARATSTDAAFIHKTLVIWVAILAVPLLRERVGVLHVAAIALLIAGQADLAADLGALDLGSGEMMVLGATVLWSVEVVVAKTLLAGLSPLTVGVSRMSIGAVVLLGWCGITGRFGELTGATSSAWAWALLTGAILTMYVVTWFSALARANAVDVTAVLVFAAVITAALDAGIDGLDLAPQRVGLVLITVGTAVAALAALRAPRPAAAT